MKNYKALMTSLLILWGIIYAHNLCSQTYSIYVGEHYTLPYPTAPRGYVTAVGYSQCSKDGVATTGLDVYVTKYFSGSATVSVDYGYSYTDSYTGRRVVETGTAYYSISCKSPTMTLNAQELVMEVDEEYELEYTSNPSGLEFLADWTTSDPNIVMLYNGSWRETDKLDRTTMQKVTIVAKGVGTCYISCDGYNGKPASKCKVNVVDLKWVKADIASGNIKRGTLVTLTSSKEGAVIYYTIDGSEPTKKSSRYTQPIAINETMTLKAKAYLGNEESNTTVLNYNVVAYTVGDVFTYTTKEGVELQMKVYEVGCLQVGSGEAGYPAVDKEFTGHITIPYSVDGMSFRKIAEYAFDGCKLSSISIGSSYVDIYSYAFRGCSNLLEISIPFGCCLFPWSFENCTSLKTIEFPSIFYFSNYRSKYSTTKNNASNVFSGCNSIKRIYMNNSYPYDINDDVFPESVYSKAMLYVPESALSSFKSTKGWQKFANIESTKSAEEKQIQLTTSLFGNFVVTAGTKVVLSSPNVPDAEIYYTLDGTNPTISSTIYTTPGVIINKKCILKAIACKDGYEDSNIFVSGIYEIKSSTPTFNGNVKKISAGNGHSLMLLADGSLWGFGSNGYGQLGDGTTTYRKIPKKIMDDVATMSAGDCYSLIVKKDGTAWACGSNYLGKLGDGTDGYNDITRVTTPVKILDGVASVSAGESHSLFVKADGSLWACGKYPLSNGNTATQLTPKKITDGVASVSAGVSHSLIVKTDGSLWAYGWNFDGELGDGTTTVRTTPKKIMDGVTTVSAGGSHSLIVKADGSLWVCGWNRYGQLGDGTTTSHKTPVKIMENVASVSGGEDFSLILKKNGSLWACGRNYGELGDGTSIDRLTPVKIVDSVIAVSAGSSHSIFVKSDGSPWTSGVGSVWNNATPFMVAGPAEDQNIVLSTAGYATFYDSYSSYTMPNELSASVIEEVDNGKLKYKKLVGNIVPVGTPVMIESDTKQAGNFILKPSESTITYSGTNLLHGSDEATTTTGDGYHYKLCYGQSGTNMKDVFGWYWGSAEGNAFQIDGHKAWLVVPKTSSGGTRGYTIEGEATGIDVINTDNEGVYHDLQGRRISKPVKKGIYIRNGKIVINH